MLALGLKPETADCFLLQINDGDWENYETQAFASYMDREKMLTMESIFPAWSLSRLLDLLPKSIEQVNRPNADLNINSDGQYWFVTYEELIYDIKHQEMNNDLFDAVISTTQWLIYNNHFNKQYHYCPVKEDK